MNSDLTVLGYSDHNLKIRRFSLRVRIDEHVCHVQLYKRRAWFPRCDNGITIHQVAYPFFRKRQYLRRRVQIVCPYPYSEKLYNNFKCHSAALTGLTSTSPQLLTNATTDVTLGAMGVALLLPSNCVGTVNVCGGKVLEFPLRLSLVGCKPRRRLQKLKHGKNFFAIVFMVVPISGFRYP